MISSSFGPLRALSNRQAHSAKYISHDAAVAPPNCTAGCRRREVRVHEESSFTRTPTITRPGGNRVAPPSKQEVAGGFQSPKVLGLNGLREGGTRA
jgi:hypothetical protein